MDSIADMITRIQNAGAVRKEAVVIPYSKLKFAIANLLLKEGYISSVGRKGKKEHKFIEVGIAYDDGTPKINKAVRVSKSSRRLYTGFRDIKSVRQGYGDAVLSTPKGIVTGKEARKLKVGGEILFTIW
ncbi:MAG: 30S ribosomal protein S8 [Parcubacteria group bacterium]|nr:30S ribosomal protein S8 [Parcubacteria group bacterium]